MKIISAILLGGLTAGVLDILYAFLVYGPLSYGLSPVDVLHSVAAGWMGRDAASSGGWNTALIGLGSHFMIALLMAAAYVLAATRMAALTARPILWGVLYGLVLYVAMNYVVVPLSAAATGEFASSPSEVVERLQTSFSMLRPRIDPDHVWIFPGTIFTHTILVGVPITLAAKRTL